MKQTIIAIFLLISASNAFGQSILEGLVKIDHTWVQGSYWSPGQYPGLGVLVDVQENTMFGAVYGYMGNEPSFVVFVGTTTSIDPLIFEGDVYFVIVPGVEEVIVGTFRWETTYAAATPAARLTITSNILNATNLPLVRFAYLEEDNVDTVTGGDWTIAVRLLGITFGDHYAISDERFVDDGITYATVIDLADTDNIGLVGYFPPAQGDVYSMLVQFDDDTNSFYVFFANNGNMYGRYWLLDEGEDPTGNGSFFRGVSDTLQVQNYGGGGDPVANQESLPQNNRESNEVLSSQIKQLRRTAFQSTTQNTGQGFPEHVTKMAFRKLSAHLERGRSELE